MEQESTLRVAAELKNLNVIRHFVQETAESLDVDQRVIGDVILATDEAVTNVMVHGYQGQPGIIEIELRRNEDSLVVCLRDQSAPFDPTVMPPPDVTVPLEERPPGGLGIHLMR